MSSDEVRRLPSVGASSETIGRRLVDPREPESMTRLRALFSQHPKVFTGELASSPAINIWIETQSEENIRRVALDAGRSWAWLSGAGRPEILPEVGRDVSTSVTLLGAGLGGGLHGLTDSGVASTLAAAVAAVTAVESEQPTVREYARALGRGVASGLLYVGVRDAVRRNVATAKT
jgi:hypothetical protein